MLKIQILVMMMIAIGGVVSSLTGAVNDTPPPSNVNGLVYVLAAIFAGGMSTAMVNLYKQKKLGKAQGDQLLASAMNEAISAANVMLIAYRKDLVDANQVKTELTEILVKRNERIGKLEQELGRSNGEKLALKGELETGVTELARTKEELKKAREDEEELRIKIRTLEGIVQTKGGSSE